MENIGEKSFCAEDFVDKLLNEAGDITCDENSIKIKQWILPPYYDEKMYKKGQKFFYKHIFALFFSKILGLLSLGGLEAVKLLKLTNKSSSPMLAYRRYVATIFHMLNWYDGDFTSGSALLSSIEKVRKMHNSASKLGSKKIQYPINQKDMVMTQFGFMGLVVARSEMVGIHNASEDELKCFIHLWRVVGYLLGIEDKYNICRESVKETKDISNLVIDRYIYPALKHRPEDYVQMSRTACEGFWAMNPVIRYDAFICYVYMVLENTTCDHVLEESLKNLIEKRKSRLKFIEFLMAVLKYSIVRIVLNYYQMICIWAYRHFPILAYYKFGIQNSHVTI